MKGSVFNGFENYVEQSYGLHVWQRIIDNSTLENNGVFLDSDAYNDQELISIVTELSICVSKSVDDIQREFGEFFFTTLYSLARKHVEHIDNLFEFLRAVDDVIHVEVNKSDSSAYTPAFFYDQPSDNELVMRYVSKRKMCYFAEGLIIGAARQFKTVAKISQSKCIHCGDDYCLINITL